MAIFRIGSAPGSRAYLLPVAYVTFIIVLGGGSRSDIMTLPLLRGVAVAALVVILATARWNDIRRYPVLAFLGAASLILAGLHLLPLPPALWQALPGHDLIARIDTALATQGTWRPLSIAPPQTSNALFALTVPFSVLVLLMRYPRPDREALVAPLILLGVLSGLIGLLQIAGGPSSRFYFYDITNIGSPVGLFSNRNHQAVFIATMFPMLAVWGSRATTSLQHARFRMTIAAVGAALLLPLLLVLGSRGGLAIGLMGIGGAALLFKRPQNRLAPRRTGGRNFPLIPISLSVMAIAVLGLVTILSSRAESLSRLMGNDEVEELRILTFRPVLELIAEYMPFGSGLGTFVEAFQRDEPAFMLQPTYFNHAHDDFLELAVTGGLPAIALIALGLIWAARQSLRAWRKSPTGQPDRLARLGSVIVAILASASVVDYPLRTPALATLLVIAAIWLAGEGRKLSTEVE